MVDYLLGFVGIVPWRCERCGTRFHARPIPFRYLVYAHCRICGNLELQRISPEYVSGPASLAGRLLRLPALRCAPCRNKFISLRPVLREQPQSAEPSLD